MGIEHPPRNKKDRRPGAGNIVSLRHQGEEFFDVLSPLLEEAATFSDDEPPRQGIHSAPSLIEENARLRVPCGQAVEPRGKPPCSEVGECRPVLPQ